jgi:translation initiation factor IF-1
MGRGEMIEVDGKVKGCLGRDLYEVVLENGHRVEVYCERKLSEVGTRVLSGGRVWIRLTVRDLSKGRLLRVLD